MLGQLGLDQVQGCCQEEAGMEDSWAGRQGLLLLPSTGSHHFVGLVPELPLK